MLTVYSDTHRLHHGKQELIDGKLMPVVEMPRRADTVLAEVKARSLGEVIAPDDHGRAPIERIHDPRFVAFLETAWDDWSAAGRDYDALPFCWGTRTLRQDVDPARLVGIDAKLGYFSFDAGTPITAGTWTAAYTSAQVALTGRARLTDTGARAVFALCRPPGHHAGMDTFGGYCFLNNAAIAAQSFLDAGARKVAILDVDYHHGNGTQQIFYSRSDVLFCSIHGHPQQEFPFFLGWPEEIGQGPGHGFNHNFPLPWGSGQAPWFEAFEAACRKVEGYGPEVVVVSLGVDTFKDDPISKFRLETSDYPKIGERIAAFGCPVLFVMEGGYAVDQIGVNTVGLLTGFESAAG